MANENDALLELASGLNRAVSSFDLNGAAILKAAFEDGGDREVAAVLEAVQDLRDARWELILRKLDTTAAGFDALAKDAEVETAKLDRSIRDFQAASTIINTAAGIINIVGRILIRFGV